MVVNRADRTGLNDQHRKLMRFVFEPLWRADGSLPNTDRQEETSYQKQLGSKHPQLSQTKKYKLQGSCDWARAHPGDIIWRQPGSGFVVSAVDHAAAYEGPRTVEALQAHLFAHGRISCTLRRLEKQDCCKESGRIFQPRSRGTTGCTGRRALYCRRKHV